MPYVIDGDGNCHVYVDAAADLSMAEDIIVNAKTQRPSVCNAAETLLVHDDVADAFNRLYYFERAAETYIRALQTGQPLRVLSHEIASKTAQELEDYPGQAERHLAELKAILDGEGSDYAA